MSITRWLVDSYLSVPIVTRIFATISVLLGTAVYFDLISELDLYFNPKLTFGRLQAWRLLTNFFYFGKMDFLFMLNILYSYQYCYALETREFTERTGEFILMFCFSMSTLLVLGYLAGLLWLNESLVVFTIYVWSKRNPHARMELFGVLVCRAVYLPFVFLVISLLFEQQVSKIVIGFVVGHVYYHAHYVFPAEPNGFHIIRLPEFLKLWYCQSTERSQIEEVVDEASTMLVPEFQDTSTSTSEDADASTSSTFHDSISTDE